MFPVYLNESQVPIGENWTVVCPLQADHSYHVYCYGEWVHTGDAPKIDYDIYVYNPQGELEGTHPETTGDWLVQAVFDGNSSVYACESETVKVAVEEPSFLVTYGLFIGAGVGVRNRSLHIEVPRVFSVRRWGK